MTSRGVVSLKAAKMPPVCSQRTPSLPKIWSQSKSPALSWLAAVRPRSETPTAPRTPNPRSVKFKPLRTVRPTPSKGIHLMKSVATPPCKVKSSSNRPTSLSANAVATAVRKPKQRRNPRATLYSPPPSQTLNSRVERIRPSPGSNRSIISPRESRSYLQEPGGFSCRVDMVRGVSMSSRLRSISDDGFPEVSGAFSFYVVGGSTCREKLDGNILFTESVTASGVSNITVKFLSGHAYLGILDLNDMLPGRNMKLFVAGYPDAGNFFAIDGNDPNRGSSIDRGHLAARNGRLPISGGATSKYQQGERQSEQLNPKLSKNIHRGLMDMNPAFFCQFVSVDSTVAICYLLTSFVERN